jgi:8-hydroxy-5-deazaflavin:NADPH oxidoreductase
MKVGILGSGAVATTLAGGFIKHAHEVMLGTRTPAKLADFSAKNSKAKIGSFSDAAKFGEIVVLAVKGAAALDALRAAANVNLAGKTVMDATNPIAEVPPENGVLSFFTDRNKSLMEKLQNEFDNVHFVKVFSCVGAAGMVNPQFKEGKPTMFICGNNDAAKMVVTGILDQFGWETEDMGKAEAARAIEPLCILWCIPGFTKNDWMHSFKMLR